MKIGLRKMILVPKIVSQLTEMEKEVKVEVKIYNASRQQLRISKNTNIAKLYLGKVNLVLEVINILPNNISLFFMNSINT